MANQRHPNQKLVAFALDKELLAAMDTARQELGLDRSSYIRAAVLEKLQVLKVSLPASLKDAPDRTGKTYRPRTITSYRDDAKVSSRPPSVVKQKAVASAGSALKLSQELTPKPKAAAPSARRSKPGGGVDQG